MAEKVSIEVELKQSLKQVTEATRAVKLDKSQAERVEKYTKGAQLALDSGDLKTFQKNFNNLIKTFKEAAAVTGKVSEEVKKLTDRQAILNQEINRLKDKKTILESKLTKDKTRLTTGAAREFAKTNVDAKKVIKADGTQATRDEIIKVQVALTEFLKETGTTLRQLRNEDLKAISSKAGVDISQRNSALAANRYVQAEDQYFSTIKSDINETSTEIETNEQEYAGLTNELTRMSQAAASGADSIEQLYTAISKIGNDTNAKITEEVNTQKLNKTDRTAATKGSIDANSIAKNNTSLGKAVKQLAIYKLAINAVKKALQEAVKTVKELDKYLTEQAMVTGKTREETYKLLGSYQDLAKACGATTKEIAQVATEYMKQGKTIEDSLILTEAAVKAAKVARVSVGDSVNYLTTALNGFQLEARDAMSVSDKFAAIAASSATDYDELAIALSKVASQANLAGMSIDYTTALLAKGLETTREAPETMGTALKTIIARMRELGDYGETLDDGMDINNVETQLKYVGIALRDSNGELRSTEDVLDELGHKWDDLNKNQQAAVAKALAGTRQQARLIAMMEDYERVIELQEISERSTGATTAQAEVYLEGMEAALNRIQVA
jgi:TP901 family phage tail tape measure protein